MVDLNRRSNLSERINYFVDENLRIDAVCETERNYLGCSVLGEPCERVTLYEGYLTLAPLLNPESRKYELVKAAKEESLKDAVSVAHWQRIFKRGHMVEDAVAWWLRNAGFIMVTEDPMTGMQIEVSFCNKLIKGHADGLIASRLRRTDCPTPPIEFPCLWECKCLAHRYTNELKRKGLAQARPAYYAQMQLYMYGLGLNHGLLTCVDADTMDLHHELVEYDQHCVDLMSARAQRIITAIKHDEWLPRCAGSAAAVACKMCRWSDFCWGTK